MNKIIINNKMYVFDAMYDDYCPLIDFEYESGGKLIMTDCDLGGYADEVESSDEVLLKLVKSYDIELEKVKVLKEINKVYTDVKSNDELVKEVNKYCDFMLFDLQDGGAYRSSGLNVNDFSHYDGVLYLDKKYDDDFENDEEKEKFFEDKIKTLALWFCGYCYCFSLEVYDLNEELVEVLEKKLGRKLDEEELMENDIIWDLDSEDSCSGFIAEDVEEAAKMFLEDAGYESDIVEALIDTLENIY